MKNKLFKLKEIFATFYYCNQYIIRFIKGKYSIKRASDEIEWNLEIYSRRTRGE